MRKTSVLITGVAGFIGFHCAKFFAEKEFDVVGIDNLNSYYDVDLKLARLKELEKQNKVTFVQTDIADYKALEIIFAKYKPKIVIHLAAQAGVRFSIDSPLSYADSNLSGFVNILEACRAFDIQHLIYASSSSVYGENTKVPFAEKDTVEKPISLYAATKRANELMAYTYNHLFNIPVTGLRFFSVYGPWGRPDMAYYKFTKAIIEGTPIDVYNNGEMERDFTFIDDIVEGIYRVTMMEVFEKGTQKACYNIFNIGNNKPVKLGAFISVLEDAIGKKALRNFLPLQQGDVLKTYADITALGSATGFTPRTTIVDGLQKFVDWYKQYYGTAQ